MKKIITLTLTFLCLQLGFSQITLEHTYSNSSFKMTGINLSNSGFKYQLVNTTTNQVILYNPDHSIFKTMSFGALSGRTTVLQ